jgi:hypothetical protein
VCKNSSAVEKEVPVKTDAFDKVKDQIGCCGIWCGSCVVGTGVLTEITRSYKELVTSYGLEAWGPKNVSYPEFYGALESIQAVPVCPGCLEGGGRDDCELRSCVTAKGLTDCALCDAGSTCRHADLLEHMRSGAAKAGLFVKTNDVPREELLEEWTAIVKSKWPFSILFSD